jgi:putative membrane protein
MKLRRPSMIRRRREASPGCAMKLAPLTAAAIAALTPTSGRAQGPGPWQMHDWMGWGWGGMWLGPLIMIAVLALLVAGSVALVRRIGGGRDGGGRARTARDILDERYARGEIDREEYRRRRDDIAGGS